MRKFSVLLFCLASCAFSSAPLATGQSWKILTTGIDTNVRGLSAARIPSSGKIAIWAGGSHGVVLRSIDSGNTWTRLSVPGPSDLDFRGMVAFDDKTAYLMSSGEGDKSRIYKTTDGGAVWQLQFAMVDKAVFLDSIACLSPTSCFALGDPINGKFLILKTTDGTHWNPLPQDSLPAALPNEGAFAASNSNLLLVSERELFVVTGGFNARVLHTTDGGKTWTAAPVPIAADNASSGIFAIARSADSHFVVVGGDYSKPAVALRVAAITSDPAAPWQPPPQQPQGYRSAVVAIGPQTFVTVGPTGSDLSTDSGAHWQPIPNAPSLNALFFLDDQHLYAAGGSGAIVQLILHSDSKM